MSAKLCFGPMLRLHVMGTSRLPISAQRDYGSLQHFHLTPYSQHTIVAYSASAVAAQLWLGRLRHWHATCTHSLDEHCNNVYSLPNKVRLCHSALLTTSSWINHLPTVSQVPMSLTISDLLVILAHHYRNSTTPWI